MIRSFTIRKKPIEGQPDVYLTEIHDDKPQTCNKIEDAKNFYIMALAKSVVQYLGDEWEIEEYWYESFPPKRVLTDWHEQMAVQAHPEREGNYGC